MGSEQRIAGRNAYIFIMFAIALGLTGFAIWLGVVLYRGNRPDELVAGRFDAAQKACTDVTGKMQNLREGPINATRWRNIPMVDKDGLSQSVATVSTELFCDGSRGVSIDKIMIGTADASTCPAPDDDDNNPLRYNQPKEVHPWGLVPEVRLAEDQADQTIYVRPVVFCDGTIEVIRRPTQPATPFVDCTVETCSSVYPTKVYRQAVIAWFPRNQRKGTVHATVAAFDDVDKTALRVHRVTPDTQQTPSSAAHGSDIPEQLKVRYFNAQRMQTVMVFVEPQPKRLVRETLDVTRCFPDFNSPLYETICEQRGNAFYKTMLVTYQASTDDCRNITIETECELTALGALHQHAWFFLSLIVLMLVIFVVATNFPQLIINTIALTRTGDSFLATFGCENCVKRRFKDQ